MIFWINLGWLLSTLHLQILFPDLDVYTFCECDYQVAYVLGQLQKKAASDALSDILEDVKEHPMVRHEAAEALGSIAGIILLHRWVFFFSLFVKQKYERKD